MSFCVRRLISDLMITFLFDSNVVEYLLSVFCVCELILNAAVSARSSLKKNVSWFKKEKRKKKE